MARVGAAVLMLSVLVAGVSAQSPNSTTRDVVVVTGRVDRIDPFSRSLTLRTPEGALHTVYANKELKAFDELRSGDMVTVRIFESVVVAVRPGGRMTAVEDSTAAAKKARGSDVDVMQQLKATVRVESINPASQMITYKTGDNRTVIRQVADPHLLDGLKAGDLIEITYTRERALDLTKNR